MALTEQATIELQELTWALADDYITVDDAKKLEGMLLADPDARKLYVQCMQLQADLHLFFNPDAAKALDPSSLDQPLKTTPVLTNLPTIGSGPGSNSTSSSV